jgi:hypothetical protein
MLETVLMTSCHVSLQRKNGPLTSHTKVNKNTAMKAELEPVIFAALWAIRANQKFVFGIFYNPAPEGNLLYRCRTRKETPVR